MSKTSLNGRATGDANTREARLRVAVAAAMPLSGLVVLFAFRDSWQPWQRLAGATLGMLCLIKAAVFFRESRTKFSAVGKWIFFTCWPGVDPSPFGLGCSRVRKDAGDGSQTLADSATCSDSLKLMGRGAMVMLIGLAMVVAVAFGASRESDWIGWVGIAALFVTLHLGFANVLTGAVRLNGWPVRRLFENPFQSRSLGDFWGRRWNLAFVEMDRMLFMRPLRRVLGARGAILGVFVISGFLHEMAISYPVQAGWGGPMAYFVLQGVLVLFESRYLKRWPVAALRVWAWFWIFAPLPLLFHAPFRERLIVPLFRNLNHWIFP